MSLVLSDELIAAYKAGNYKSAMVLFRRDNPRTIASVREVAALVEGHLSRSTPVNPHTSLALEEALIEVSAFDEITASFLDELHAGRWVFKAHADAGATSMALDLAMVFSALLRIMRSGYNPTPLMRAFLTKAMPALRAKDTGHFIPDFTETAEFTHVRLSPWMGYLIEVIEKERENPSANLTTAILQSQS